MTSKENVEEIFSKCLMSNIKIFSDAKVLKEGKLLLFSVKDFFCIFTLVNSNSLSKRFIFELPYPFDIQSDGGKITLDYTVKTFCTYNKNVEKLLTKIKTQKTSKFYNKKLYVQIVPV